MNQLEKCWIDLKPVSCGLRTYFSSVSGVVLFPEASWTGKAMCRRFLALSTVGVKSGEQRYGRRLCQICKQNIFLPVWAGAQYVCNSRASVQTVFNIHSLTSWDANMTLVARSTRKRRWRCKSLRSNEATAGSLKILFYQAVWKIHIPYTKRSESTFRSHANTRKIFLMKSAFQFYWSYQSNHHNWGAVSRKENYSYNERALRTRYFLTKKNKTSISCNIEHSLNCVE